MFIFRNYLRSKTKPLISLKGKIQIVMMNFIILFLGWVCTMCVKNQDNNTVSVKIGVYFFDGWSTANNPLASDPNKPWAKDAPYFLTPRMVEEFSGREPIWGWRADSPDIVEKQIDLAVDHGINFFLFDWYWRDSNGSINLNAIKDYPLHTQMNMFFEAKNRNRLEFGLLVANHGEFEIRGADNWEKATQYWIKYFKDPKHVTVDSKPLVVIFNSNGIDEESIERMQKVARDNGFPGLSIAGCGNPLAKGFTFGLNITF